MNSLIKPYPHLNLVLAPMEGVTDAPMRELLTKRGCFDFCVSEFLRISHSRLPDKVFLKHIPELEQGGMTLSGCPVIPQLLGGKAELLAESALQLIDLGALGVDLNFGCPAPTVNRHDGGATLLKFPERIEEIVSAVRNRIPSRFSVSAKLRLGWDHKEAIFENAKRAERGGANWITVHARTKMQGYAPPADWEILGHLALRVKIPLIVNGDLWTVQDLKSAEALTGCRSFMLGRGAVSDPELSNRIRNLDLVATDWEQIFRDFFETLTRFGYPDSYFLGRAKQWLRLAALRGQFLGWDTLKQVTTREEFFHSLGGSAIH